MCEQFTDLLASCSPASGTDLMLLVAVHVGVTCNRSSIRHASFLSTRRGRSDQRRELPCLCRAGPGAGDRARRYCDYGQSRQPQRPSCSCGHPQSRGAAVLPAALFTRPQPNRAGFAKLKGLLRKARARTIDAMSDSIRESLTCFQPAECRNYLLSARYASS